MRSFQQGRGSEKNKDDITLDKMEFVISHLAKSYGKHQVLVDADYAFEEGKIYGLLGRNGSGKTTLFNCLNSDTEINGGSFYFRRGEMSYYVSCSVSANLTTNEPSIILIDPEFG